VPDDSQLPVKLRTSDVKEVLTRRGGGALAKVPLGEYQVPSAESGAPRSRHHGHVRRLRLGWARYLDPHNGPRAVLPRPGRSLLPSTFYVAAGAPVLHLLYFRFWTR